MKLIINQPELEEIVRQHVRTNVSFNTGSDIEIEFTATRGADGITASIDIPYMGVSSLSEVIIQLPDKAQEPELLSAPRVSRSKITQPATPKTDVPDAPVPSEEVDNAGSSEAKEEKEATPPPATEGARKSLFQN